LSPTQEVNDFFTGAAFVHGGAVGHQGDGGKIVNTKVTEFIHGEADVLQRNARVQQPFDNLQHQNVFEGVEALRP